jgi:type II secretory pathway pseudopilin PulG
MRELPLATPHERQRRRSRASVADEAGFMFTEFIVAAAIGLVLAAAMGSFLVTSLRSANAASSRTIAARQAEVFLARLTREVRQAQNIRNTVTGANTTPVNVVYGGSVTSVSFFLPKAGSSASGSEVTWSCSTTTSKCTRSVAGGSTVTQLSGIESATLTPYSSKGSVLASGAGAAIAASPQYPSSVQITLKVQDISQLDTEHTHVVPGVEKPIVVQDGVSLRNYSS